MRHITTVLCVRALIDQVTNSLSLIETIDSISSPPDQNKGFMAIPADLLSLWERSNPDQTENARARVSILAPDGTNLVEPLVYEVDLRNTTRARNFTKFPVFPFNGAGRHVVSVDMELHEGEWQRVAEWPVVVAPLNQAKT